MSSLDDPLYDWPYAYRTVEEDLNPNLIERHGLLHLFRSLNIGNLVAFVGSGTSSAYGRLSWPEMVVQQKKLVEGLLKELKNREAKAGVTSTINSLESTFKSLDQFRSAEAYPIVFQIGEQLYETLIDELNDEADASRVNYREKAQRLTYDDREFCINLLRIAEFGEQPNNDLSRIKKFDKRWTKDQLPLSRSLPKRDESKYNKYLLPFKVDAFQYIAEKVVAHLSATNNRWEKTCRYIYKTFASQQTQIYVTPTHRFLVAALLSLKPGLRKDLKNNFCLQKIQSRKDIMDRNFDPLEKLLMTLGISRYLTTNYDLEIERLLLDRGYRLYVGDDEDQDGFRADRLNPIGGQARDITFDAANAAELVVMSTQQSSTDPFVVHLHGRSTADSDIVVTERDYMDLYLRRDDARDLIDESVSIAFSANPVLFVGLGMSEADLMRPLRQFMSDQENRRYRTAVALMPIKEDYDESITQRITLFMRYGVHLVHYGCVTSDGNRANERPFPWLGKVKEIIHLAKKYASWAPTDKTPDDLRENLKSKITELNNRGQATTTQFDGFPTIDTPEMIDGEEVSARLKDHVDLLNSVIQVLVDNKSGGNNQNREKIQEAQKERNERFSSLVLDGVSTAITTIALCTRLDGIENGWRRWWQSWQRSPTIRAPALSDLGQSEVIDRPTVNADHVCDREPSVSRHRLKHSSSNPEHQDLRVARIHSTDAALRSSTFRQLKDAVRKLRKSQNREKSRRRRIFVIAAARGMGKGHLFAEFQVPENEKTFIEDSWSINCHPEYSPSIFINLSFSSEVSSAWDGMIRSLEANWADFAKPSENGNRRITNASSLPRTIRLRRALELQSECNGRRVLIAINAIDLLFRETGDAKNAEVARIFHELCGPNSKELPFDLVVIGNELRLPSILRRRLDSSPEAIESNYLPSFYVYQESTDTALDRIKRRRHASRIRVAHTQDKDYTNFAMFPEAFKAYDFFLDRFMRLALLFVLDWNFGLRRDNFFAEGHGGIKVRVKKSESGKPYLRFEEDSFITLLSNLTEENDNPAIKLITYLHQPENRDKEGLIETDNETFSLLLRENYEKSRRSTRIRQWDEVLQAFNNNRFILTILLRAADYVAEKKLEELYLLKETVYIDDIVQPIERLIVDTMLHALAASTGRREEVVLSDVLDCYERFHQRGDAKLDFFLQLALLRHLAVVGQPTSADVLTRAPEIRNYLREYYTDRKDLKSRIDFESIIENGLEELSNRCLVFRIVPLKSNGGGDKTPNATSKYRYTLHRLTQRHVFRKMDGPLIEFAETNEYAVSLYAAQSSDLPRPTIEAYRFLRDLVNGLTDYPERSPWANGYTPSKPRSSSNSDSPELRIRALRASIGVIRSIFSIAVVSRFREYDDLVDVPSKPGYLAEHRLQIRWLLKRAQDLDVEVQQGDTKIDQPLTPSDNPQTSRGRSDAPFYLDEVVWLYNECGVIALVQGNMSDSVALLRQALKVNQNAEGKIGYGAQGARIALNLAIAQIERANLRSAGRRLRDILSTDNEDRVVRAIAQGYLALIKQIGGSHERAQELYREAIDLLIHSNQIRAASILYRHWGDSLVISSPSDQGVEEGLNKIKQAVSYAQTGGHEDVRQVARLALIRARTRKGGVIQPEISNQLTDIEGYARSMEMPRLQCEALHLRARILAQQGEQKLAGLLITESISIATRNDLRLRKISAMTLYGRILISRGLHEQGKHVATAAMNLARRAGYQNAIERAERALRALPPGQMDHAVRVRLSQR